MNSSNFYPVMMLIASLVALVAFGIIAFLIHPFVGLIYTGLIAYAIAWAANECRKDEQKEEDES